jgi:transposase
MVVQLGELMMILDLHRQGLSITAIARRTGRDPKTVRKYIERGLGVSGFSCLRPGILGAKEPRHAATQRTEDS